MSEMDALRVARIQGYNDGYAKGYKAGRRALAEELQRLSEAIRAVPDSKGKKT